jgi:hypothetical protein
MVAIHRPNVPMVLPRTRRHLQLATAVMAASSVVAVTLIGSVAMSVLAMQGRTRRRHLRYRVANAGRRAMHVGLRRSIAVAERVSYKLPR